MGKECFCDFCRKVVPVETALQDISVGGTSIGQACFNCASTLTNGLRQQMADANKNYQMHIQAPAQHSQPQGKQEPPKQEELVQSRTGPSK